MAQVFLDGMTAELRGDLKKLVRQEIEAEDNKKQLAFTEATFITNALWPVHELKATVIIIDPNTTKNSPLFDLIPGLQASVRPKDNWVGLTFPKTVYESLHGDLTWSITIRRKDSSTRDPSLLAGKFNYGRFLVKNDECVNGWGTSFASENFDIIKDITIEVTFKRNNDKKCTKWKIIEEHTNEEQHTGTKEVEK